MSRPGRLAGKVVLLTGIGGGQGRAAALLFAREGALVVGCDVDADTAAETARRWVEDGARVHGRIDVVYNNAARTALGPFPEISLDDYRYAVANEIDLVWHVCQASWSHLAASKGVIISTASIAGLIGTRDLKQAAHALLKGGIIALTRQLAAEGAQHGIRANSISPGVIAIPAVQAQIDLLGDDAPMMSMVRTTADGRPGQPEDIAYAALFLASDEARFINGENLVVDGGATVILG